MLAMGCTKYCSECSCVCVCVCYLFAQDKKREKATNSYSLECICVWGKGEVWVCGGDYPLFVFDFAFFSPFAIRVFLVSSYVGALFPFGTNHFLIVLINI